MDEQIRIRYLAARETKRNWERNWRLNLSFIMNEQYVTYDKYSDKLQLIPFKNGKPRLVANLIVPRMRLEYSSLTAEPPTFKVDCRTHNKSKDIYYFLLSTWDTYKFEDTYQEALLWAIACGEGYIKTYFDSGAGPVYGSARGGDPIIDVCSPFEITMDPFARSPDEAGYIFHEKVRSQDYVKKKYGKTVSSGGDVSLLYPGLTSFRVKYEQTRIPSVILSEYWERPSDDYPDGQYIVFSGTEELYDGDGRNPYATQCPIPFDRVRHTPFPGEQHGHTWITDTRQTNVLYNRLRSDVLENSTKLSNPPLLTPMGAIPGDVNMEPGELIKYNPLAMHGGKIDQLDIQPFPSQVVNVLVRLEQEADEFAGVTAMSKGGMPRGVRSAQQMFALQQAEDQRRQIVLGEYGSMINSSMNKVLKLSRDFIKLPRYVFGGNESFIFSGKDVPPDALVKVKVDLKKQPPGENEQQTMANLFKMGVIQDPRILARMSKYGSSEDAFIDADLDTTQSQRENKKLVQGVPVQVEDWHNHLVHLIEHNRFRKSEDYENNVQQNGKQNMNMHCAMHQQFVQMNQAQQQPNKEGVHADAATNGTKPGPRPGTIPGH